MKKRKRAGSNNVPDGGAVARLRSMGLQAGGGFDREMRDSFLLHIESLEREPTHTIREQMAARRIEVPADLWTLIGRFAELGIVIERTDHLDDDALYAFLIGYLDEYVELPESPLATVHIDVLGSGSPEDNTLTLRYYADEEEREFWRTQFPEDELPPREQPPFDRDRFLPTAEDRRRGLNARAT